MAKRGKKGEILTGLSIFLLIIVFIIILITAGCTGTADEGMIAEMTVVTEEETLIVPSATEVVAGISDMNEIIAIDLVSMYHDIQNDDPLAFSYEILPTRYTGLDDDGDYIFEGTIMEYNTGGDETNYLGVLFTEADDESETGYREWVYKGLKYDVYGGEGGQNITIEFTVGKEDIPVGKTVIMTGYDLYLI